MRRYLTLFFIGGLIALSSCSFSNFVGKQMPTIHPDYVSNKVDWTGKPLLLEFWATWCPPCRHSIARLNQIYDKFGPHGLIVVGISDEKHEILEKAIVDLNIQYHVASDTDGKISNQFKIWSIPHAFLVDHTGKIVWEGNPSELTDDQIDKLLH